MLPTLCSFLSSIIILVCVCVCVWAWTYTRYSPIVLTKHNNQVNLSQYKKGIFGTYNPGVIKVHHHCVGKRDNSHDCWSWKLRVEGLHIEPQPGNRENRRWQEAFKTQILLQCCPYPIKFYLLSPLHSITNKETSIQTSKSKRSISFKPPQCVGVYLCVSFICEHVLGHVP